MFSSLLGGGQSAAFAEQVPSANVLAAEAWQQLEAEDRFLKLREQHPLLPPPFAMPRAHRATWGRLWEGPLRAMVHTWQDEGSPDDPERIVEERTFDRCQKSMDRRRAETTCVRQCGCQVVLTAFTLVCLLLHIRVRSWQLKSTVLTYFLTLEWMLLLFLLATSWVQAVVQCADVTFFWLAVTYEEVDCAGASMALSVRRHLLLRVLGLLHCPRNQAPELRDRLGGGPFPEVLEGVASMFHEEQLEADGFSIETGCLFVDDQGQVQRFVWWLDADLPSGTAGSTSQVAPVVTKVRDLDYRDKDLSRPKFLPWAQRDMSFLIDILSPEVEEIVRSNPWWHKLEFQLKADQSRLSGFRVYLGDKVWNRRSRFVTYVTSVPLSLFAVLAACHLRYVFGQPVLTMDYWHLVPHCSLVLGIGISSTLLAAQAGTAWCARACINLAMYVLKMQVNRDWSFIMGVEEADDPEEYWRQPALSRDIDSIPVLWQVASCRSSLQYVALQVMQLVEKNRQKGLPGWSGFQG